MANVEASEKLLYTFDFPSLEENGWLEISETSIVLTFPERPNVYVKEAVDISQNSQLFLNNQIVFALNWIPMYTITDFYRVKEVD